MKGRQLDLTLEVNRVEFFIKSELESNSDKDLKKTFWTSNITSPIPNSTADSTKKKKVKDIKFKLSQTMPIERVIK